MPDETQAPKELIDAFNAYKATDEYANTFKWAAHEEHRDGSLWAAWLRGYQMAKGGLPQPPSTDQ